MSEKNFPPLNLVRVDLEQSSDEPVILFDRKDGKAHVEIEKGVSGTQIQLHDSAQNATDSSSSANASASAAPTTDSSGIPSRRSSGHKTVKPIRCDEEMATPDSADSPKAVEKHRRIDEEKQESIISGLTFYDHYNGTFMEKYKFSPEKKRKSASLNLVKQESSSSKKRKVNERGTEWGSSSGANASASATLTNDSSGTSSRRLSRRKTVKPIRFEAEMVIPDSAYSSKAVEKHKRIEEKEESIISGLTFYDHYNGTFMDISTKVKYKFSPNKKRKSASTNLAKRESSSSKKRKVNGRGTKWDNKHSIYNNLQYYSDERSVSEARFGIITQIQYLLEDGMKYLKPRAAYLGEFFLFCHERQQIWYKRRMNQPGPWTKDIIMDKQHFTNLYRELDRGTQFFRHHLIEVRETIDEACDLNVTEYDDAVEEMTLTEVLWTSLCYRLLNKVETFQRLYPKEQKLPFNHESNHFLKKLKKLYKSEEVQSQSYKIFSGAHQVVGYERYVNTISGLVADHSSQLTDLVRQLRSAGEEGDLKECTEIIQSVQNVGPFYAWQIACDLLEAGVLPKIRERENEYVLLGPGAKYGLSYIFGDDCKRCSMENMTFLLNRQDEIFELLETFGCKWHPFDGRHLSLKTLEHALCEFHKYRNLCVGNNSGRYYRPSNANCDALCTKCKDPLKYANPNKKVSCNTCRRVFCKTCVPATSGDVSASSWISWMCSDCKAF